MTVSSMARRDPTLLTLGLITAVSGAAPETGWPAWLRSRSSSSRLTPPGSGVQGLRPVVGTALTTWTSPRGMPGWCRV